MCIRDRFYVIVLFKMIIFPILLFLVIRNLGISEEIKITLALLGLSLIHI